MKDFEIYCQKQH